MPSKVISATSPFIWCRRVSVCVFIISFLRPGCGAVVGTGEFLENIIGGSDFRKFVGKNVPLVDKSPFIKEIIEDEMKVILITRPRRFGKSINLSMLKEFLTINYDTAELFEDFSIAQDENFCSKHQNKYPVVHLNFSTMKRGSFRQTMDGFKTALREAFLHHKYLASSEKLLDYERNNFAKYTQSNPKMSDSVVVDAIRNLMVWLHTHHGRKVIVLLDEFDTPLIDAFICNYHTSLVPIVKTSMEHIFKDNRHLEKGVIFGMTKIATESVFSSLSHIHQVLICDDEYSKYFGFLESEVEELQRVRQLTKLNRIQDLRDYYNGYNIGNSTVYNPWSVVMYLKNKVRDSYWTKTDAFVEFKGLMSKYGAIPTIKAKMLVDGIPLRQNFKESLVYNDIATDENTYWTYLTQLGYLTIDRVILRRDRTILCDLKIPNTEVKKEFQKHIKESAKDKQFKVPSYDTFVDSIRRNDTKKAAKILASYLKGSKRFYPGWSPTMAVGGVMKGLEKEFGPTCEIVDTKNYCILQMETHNSSLRSPQTTFIFVRIITAEREPDQSLSWSFVTEVAKKAPLSILVDNAKYLIVSLPKLAPFSPYMMQLVRTVVH